MNYLGIDYGEKRIGLSSGDSDVRLAVPIAAAVEAGFDERMAHIEAEIRTRRVGELVVGYPYNMDGSIGFKAREVDAFIDKLAAAFSLPIHRTDERLTSSDAQTRMNEAGGAARSRSKKSVQARLAERRSGVLDSRAATLILQDYLDSLPGAFDLDAQEEYFSAQDFSGAEPEAYQDAYPAAELDQEQGTGEDADEYGYGDSPATDFDAEDADNTDTDTGTGTGTGSGGRPQRSQGSGFGKKKKGRDGGRNSGRGSHCRDHGEDVW